MRADEFLEATFGTSPKRKPRTGARPPRGHTPVPRYHSKGSEQGSVGEPTNRPDDARSVLESAPAGMVRFVLDSERAYQAVMDRFGDLIDWDENEYMMVPERLWPKVQQVAYDADGIGAENVDDGGGENPEHLGMTEGLSDDNSIWNQYGHYTKQDLMKEFPNITPQDAQSIVNYAEYGWSPHSDAQKFRNEVVKRIKIAQGQDGVTEGSDIPHWRVEQSDATGRYYVVSGYTTKSRRVWKNKLGAVDFNKKEDAEAKAQELNQGVAEGLMMEDPATAFASKAHDEWRQGWIKQNSGKSVPRIKKNSDGSEGDINVPFEKLHPDWQRENLAAGRAAMQAVKQFPNDIEKAAEFIHNEWMKRNPKADYNAAQHVPYDALPESEKEKDRVHVRTMMQLMGKQGVAEDRPVDSDGYAVDQEDAGEYDYEGDQAKDQLQTIVAAARKLNGMLDDNENMPEWVQMKITKATDYLDTAADYIAANKAQAEPVAEAEPEKIGGRHDPADFDDMVSRLKKLAGAGPMKTVYDPNTRRYKNIPTAQQPRDKK